MKGALLRKKHVTVDDLLASDEVTAALEGVFRKRASVKEVIIIYTTDEGTFWNAGGLNRMEVVGVMEQTKLTILEGED